MSSEQIIWLVGAACATVFLLKMMRDRQVALNQLIRQSVEEKLSWMKKKAKAARMAQKTARQKAAQERELQEMFTDDPDTQRGSEQPASRNAASPAPETAGEVSS